VTIINASISAALNFASRIAFIALLSAAGNVYKRSRSMRALSLCYRRMRDAEGMPKSWPAKFFEMPNSVIAANIRHCWDENFFLRGRLSSIALWSA